MAGPDRYHSGAALDNRSATVGNRLLFRKPLPTANRLSHHRCVIFRHNVASQYIQVRTIGTAQAQV